MSINEWSFLEWLRVIIDITIVSYLIYKVIMVVQGTKVVQIFKGIIVVLLVWMFSGFFGLITLQFILSQIIIYGILGLMIIFQPELRSALERIGRKSVFNKYTENGVEIGEALVEDVVGAVDYMSRRNIGALICIELEDSLYDYIRTGIKINAHMSRELLINIFTPNVPLHDGAVIIRGGKLEAASCYLPLSEKEDISKDLGTRHRAAIGLGEIVDSFIIIVSEETGKISVVKDSKMYRNIDKEDLKNRLNSVFNKKEEKGYFKWKR